MPKYTKEEIEYMKKWGKVSDRNYDTNHSLKNSDGSRLTSLGMAKLREREFGRKDDPELSKHIYNVNTKRRD